LKKLSPFLLVITIIFVGSVVSSAQELVYQPINPSFGGSPLNGNWLLTYAQLQDNTTDPAEIGDELDIFEDFQKDLNRAVLSQLSRNLTNQIFGEGGELQEGLFQLGDFSFQITETLEGYQITIFDLLTGNETIILVPFP
jgi:curli production assembly/transport component CsgF